MSCTYNVHCTYLHINMCITILPFPHKDIGTYDKTISPFLTSKLKRMYLRSEAKQWVDLLAGVATADQRRRLAATGIQAATEILQGFQVKINSTISLSLSLSLFFSLSLSLSLSNKYSI